MQIDALAVRLRPRTPLEAADLGVRICQDTARAVYLCFAVVALPVFLIALAAVEIAPWLPTVIVWWLKPWLDRTVLFVLSRAAFGQPTTVAHLWRAQGDVWWRRLWFSLTWRRLSPWRSLTEPIYQLEGLPLFRAGARVRQIRQRHGWSAVLMTQTFLLTETALLLAVLSLAFWFAPAAQTPGLDTLLGGEAPPFVTYGIPVAYMAAAFFVEPFFVAAGFAMYLSRRAELEAWDIEQEFRRAFGR